MKLKLHLLGEPSTLEHGVGGAETFTRRESGLRTTNILEL